MESLIARHRGALLLGAAVIIAARGTIGFFQGLGGGFSGGLYGPRYVVDGVMPGGAGEKAGLRAGDRVISVEGKPVEELGMESRWPRSLTPRIGDTRRFVVERQGKALALDVVYGAPPRGVVAMRLGGALVVLSFMALGLWTFFSVRTSHALALAQIGLVTGAMYMSPSLGAWNGVTNLIQGVSAVLWVALLLRFFLTFPKPKRGSETRPAAYAIFGVCGLVLVLYVVEIVVHPLLYWAVGEAMSLLMLGYAALIVAAVAHTVVKTPWGALWQSGMGWILLGLLVAIVPNVVAAFGLRLPASRYYPLLFAAVPLGMALAVSKQARFAGAQETAHAA
jgi:hypothetical protein